MEALTAHELDMFDPSLSSALPKRQGGLKQVILRFVAETAFHISLRMMRDDELRRTLGELLLHLVAPASSRDLMVDHSHSLIAQQQDGFAVKLMQMTAHFTISMKGKFLSQSDWRRILRPSWVL